jgi:hypothetical protein
MRRGLERWTNVLAVERRVADGGLDPWEEEALAVAARAGRRGLFSWGPEAWARRVLGEARETVLARLAVSLLEQGRFGAHVLREEEGAPGPRLSWEQAGGAALVLDVEPPLERLHAARVRAVSWRETAGAPPARLAHPLSLLVRAEALRAGEGGGGGEAALALAAGLCSATSRTALARGAAFVKSHRVRQGGATSPDTWEGTWAREDGRRRALERTQQAGTPLCAPLARARVALGAADSVRLSPELSEAPLRLGVVAVRRELVRQAGAGGPGGEDAGALLGRLWPGEWARARRELAGWGLPPDAYALLPVHPWQLRRRVPQLFADLRASRALVPLSPRLRAWAQADGATVEPVVGDMSPLHLRLAVDAGAAGEAGAPLAPPALHGAPARALWLEGVLAAALPGPLAAFRPALARERASLGLAPERVGGEGRAGQLGLLLRDNPTLHARAPGASRRLWPVHALLAPAPFSARPLAAELRDGLAARRGVPAVEAGRLFHEAFCVRALVPCVALLARHGVALPLDAHHLWVDLGADELPVHLTLRGALGVRAAAGGAPEGGAVEGGAVEGGAPGAAGPGTGPVDVPREPLAHLEAHLARTLVHGLLADLLEVLAHGAPGVLEGGERRTRAALEQAAARVLPAGPERARLVEALWRRPAG